MIWSSHRDIVRARLTSSGMSSLQAHQSVEGEEPVPDVALARRGAGDAGAQVQRVTEFLLGDPGGGDLLPGRVAAQDARDLGELGGRQVLQVAYQQVLDAVLGVAGPAAPAVLAADHAAAHVAGHLDGQVDDVEQVDGDLRAGQHPAHRRGVNGAHVDRHDLDRVPPGGSGPGQPVRGVIRGTAFGLPSSPWPPDRSKKQVCHRSARNMYSPVCSSIRQRGRPRRYSSMPRYATRAGACSSTRSAAAANAACATGHDTPACRAASAAVIPRSATSAPACARSRPVTRHRGGTCGSHSVNVLRSHRPSWHFHRRLIHHTRTGSLPRRTSRGRASTVSRTRPETVPQSGHAAAAR